MTDSRSVALPGFRYSTYPALVAVVHALNEERGKLIVALDDLPTNALEALVEAAQLLDDEGQDALERRSAV